MGVNLRNVENKHRRIRMTKNVNVKELLKTVTVNSNLKKLAYTNCDQKQVDELKNKKVTYNKGRQHGEPEWKLSDYYSIRPVVVDTKSDTLISGYLNLEVAKEFGLDEIPVAYVDCPTLDQQVDYVLEEIGTRKKLSGADIYQIVEFMDTRDMTRGGGKKVKISSGTSDDKKSKDTYLAIAEKINVGRATIARAFAVLDAVNKGETKYSKAILEEGKSINSQYILINSKGTDNFLETPNFDNIALFKKNIDQKKGGLTKAITAGNFFDLDIDKLPSVVKNELKKVAGYFEFKVVVVEKEITSKK